MRFNFHTNEFEETSIAGDKLAVAGSDRELSWMELKEEVKKLEALFRGLRIPPGHPLLIRGHKEALFPAAIVAAIRCGIPYIPLDIIVPAERLRKVQELTGSQVMICFAEEECRYSIPILIQKDLSVEQNSVPSFTSANTYFYADDPLAYVMFTSGSTGEPKGVQITRSAILSFIDWMEHDFDFTEEDVFINQAPFSFDVSLFDILFSFQLGGTVVLNSSEVARNTQRFTQRIKKYNGTIWVSTPSFAYMFLLEPSFSHQELSSLHTFLFAGEELPSRTVSKLHSLFPGARVLNSYGPTEVTVTTTLVNITPEILANYDSLPIGFPKYTCEIVIRNEENDSSLPGEIIVAGDNVSTGYFKNQALTAEKFFLHNGKRAYRTGDHGYLRDGMVFFLGRQDDQVKLHGYRIEMGDITAHLLEIAGIDDAVTVPLRSGSTVKRIISFVKLQEGKEEKRMKEHIFSSLSKDLPSYMVPGDICFVKEFPFNASHKIDKKKLVDDYLNF